MSLHLLFVLSSFSVPLSLSTEVDACLAEESHLALDFQSSHSFPSSLLLSIKDC